MCWDPVVVLCPPFPPSGCPDTSAHLTGRVKQSPKWMRSMRFLYHWEGVPGGGGGSPRKAFSKDFSVITLR